ncbi:MAG: HPF/RaiA family ribosome-associated protein [Burkholderiaceae bacterium]
MKLPLQVSFRDMAALPSLDGEIRRRAAKLERFVPDLISCHVVIDASANRHRQGHVYAVKVDVRVPGEELFAGERQAHEEIAIALREAFDAMTRRLEDYARRRRGQVKQHAPKQRAPAAAGGAAPGDTDQDPTS